MTGHLPQAGRWPVLLVNTERSGLLTLRRRQAARLPDRLNLSHPPSPPRLPDATRPLVENELPGGIPLFIAMFTCSPTIAKSAQLNTGLHSWVDLWHGNTTGALR